MSAEKLFLNPEVVCLTEYTRDEFLLRTEYARLIATNPSRIKMLTLLLGDAELLPQDAIIVPYLDVKTADLRFRFWYIVDEGPSSSCADTIEEAANSDFITKKFRAVL